MSARKKLIIFALLILTVLVSTSCSKLFKRENEDPAIGRGIETPEDTGDQENKENKDSKEVDKQDEKKDKDESKQEDKVEDKEEKKEDKIDDKDKEKQDPKEKDIEEKKGPTIEKNIDYSKYKVGQRFRIKKEFLVYKTASDAKNRLNPSLTYPVGDYYIYSLVKDGVNLSRTMDGPGGWTDLAVIGEENFSIIQEEPSNGAKEKDYSQASKKEYNWSWGYPDSSGKSVLEKNNGLYKKYNVGNSIYLTFDNGYEYGNLTERILNILADNNVKAVFFVTGTYIENNPNLVLRMAREGHIVGNHSQNHKNHAKVSTEEVKEDLLKWENKYKNLTGNLPKIKLYRPPEGSFSERSLLIAKDLGYKTVLWSYAYNDWDTNNQPETTTSLSKLIKNNNPGTVILLHAVSETNANILDDYIKESKVSGYQFKLLN